MFSRCTYRYRFINHFFNHVTIKRPLVVDNCNIYRMLATITKRLKHNIIMVYLIYLTDHRPSPTAIWYTVSGSLKHQYIKEFDLWRTNNFGYPLLLYSKSISSYCHYWQICSMTKYFRRRFSCSDISVKKAT